MSSYDSSVPLISVVLATYNGEKYLREQLDSIFAQDYGNIEVVASDDCSSDATVEILDEYSKKYNLSWSVNERNLGFIRNFEGAMLKARGEYLALCDQDDLWAPDKLSELSNLIAEKDALLVYSNAELIDSEGASLNQDIWTSSRTIPEKCTSHQAFYLNNYVTGCTVMFRRELLELATPFPVCICHDWWLAYVSSYYGRIAWTERQLVQYRQHGANAIGARRLSRSKLTVQYLLRQLNKVNPLKIVNRLKEYDRSWADMIARLDAFYVFEVEKQCHSPETLDTLRNWAQDRMDGVDLGKYAGFQASNYETLAIGSNGGLRKHFFRTIGQLKRAYLVKKALPVIALLFVSGFIYLLWFCN
jgi:glycosyltransferase involved in cell wall biosynthesis